MIWPAVPGADSSDDAPRPGDRPRPRRRGPRRGPPRRPHPTRGVAPRWRPRYGSGNGATWTCSGRPAPPGPSNLYGLMSTSPLGVAVIRALEDGDVAPAGRGPREPERQLVRLAARVDEVRDLERSRQRGDQALGVVEDGRVEVARVRLEQGLLASRRLDHPRMGVPDVGDVVHEVEVRAAVRVVEVARPRRGRSSAAAGS